ncbi:G-type lectin S-receptor-like serine/threonine-protein kinase CES101 [Ricinus communis]|uniref:G-type lectin S-receptor-like serine/threonine-protein kinase CES101 n=1 Tax=Ricinus communis TaxID=3988 RepID=UPI00201B19F0|nr:G-type lectin S-receptor-like serine/threonine-protein kinase CES101 [Ricinus communis]
MASANLFLLFIISSLFSSNCISFAETDTIKQGQLLRDWEQLVSAGGVFRLGFFSPNPTYSIELGSSGPRHLGIWFNYIPFYSVWVANRKDPIPDSSGALTVDGDGKLKITYQGGSPIVINSNMASKSSPGGNFTATLLDSGNLVIRQVDSTGSLGPILWQSFDYPHNILLPGMKLGMNIKTGQNWTLSSWLSEKIPAPGAFKLGLDPSGANQLLIWRRDEIYWSSGVWQNGSFESAPELTKRNDLLDFRFVANEEERYFTYSIKKKSVLSRWDLDTLGQITAFILERNDSSSIWIYDTVGPCQYASKNSTAVCLTEKPTKCRNGSEMFVPKRGYIDYTADWYYDSDFNLSLSDCHAKCWKNCSCVAYKPASNDDTGCHFWSKLSNFTPGDNFDFVYLLSHQNITS